jgi:hypothetical protein
VPYKRRLSKQTDTPITPRMVTIFDQWRRASGQRRDDLHGALWDLYMVACYPHPPVWQWPVVVPPGPAPEHEAPAQELWEALAQASREARAIRRPARANGAIGTPPAA